MFFKIDNCETLYIEVFYDLQCSMYATTQPFPVQSNCNNK